MENLLNCDDKNRLMNEIADRVTSSGLGVPAIFILEMFKPLTFVFSSLMHVFGPLVHTFGELPAYSKVAEILENRNDFEELIKKIEHRL